MVSIKSLAQKTTGFTLVELLVAITIIGIIATIGMFALFRLRAQGRDAARKAEISQLGKFLTLSCFIPDAGAGNYDLAAIIAEMKEKYPQYAAALARTPKDPRLGTDAESRYRYAVTAAGRCVLYANLENGNEPVTLSTITAPAAGGGTGVLEAAADGWNGTRKYFQVSN